MILNADNILKKENTSDFRAMAKNSFIDVSVEVKRPPVALSIGKYEYKGSLYPVPFGSYGDFSAIVGASKSMKTFLKSALVAGYIGGQAQNYFPDIKGHETAGKYVIDIDTEQSLFHTHNVARRACEMVGTNPAQYVPFSLREYDPRTRFEFIEWIFNESEYRNNIGLITIDGSADLLENVNDLEASNKIVQSFMRWTKQANCHLITIIHRNHGSMKPTGHLGSSLLKKAETICFVERDSEANNVKVSPEYTRNFPFEEFAFTLNDEFLPIQQNDFI
jgi:hypothetical protein